MGKFVTMNYSGKYIIDARKVIGKDAADQFIWREEFAISPVRLGVADDGKVIGFWDSETMLNAEQKAFFEKQDGADWLEKLDKRINEGPWNLRLLAPGENININGIPLEPLDPADKKRMPKSRKATVLMGPISAEPRLVRHQEKQENKMLPSSRERVKESGE